MTRRTKRLALWVSFAGLVIVLGLLVLLRLQINTAQWQAGWQKVPPPRWPRITVAAVEVRDIVDSVAIAGTTQPAQQAVLRAEIAAAVNVVHVEIGDWVNAGSVLVEFVDADQAAAYAVAKANLEAAKSEAAFAEFDLAAKRALFSQETGLDRGVSRTEFERARFAHEAAMANAKRAQAAVDQATVALSRTVVRAPFTGIITARAVDPGSFVSPGQAVFTVVDLSAVKIQMEVSEADLAQFDLNQRIDRIELASLRTPIAGTVSAINPVAGPDGLFAVEITVPNRALPTPAFDAIVAPRDQTWPSNVYLRDVMENPPPRYGRLRPDWPAEMVFGGVPARVRLPLRRYDRAIVVPSEAVIRSDADEYYVVVVERDERLIDYFGPTETGVQERARIVYIAPPRYIGPVALLGQLRESTGEDVAPPTADSRGAETLILRDGRELRLHPSARVAISKQTAIRDGEIVVIAHHADTPSTNPLRGRD